MNFTDIFNSMITNFGGIGVIIVAFCIICNGIISIGLPVYINKFFDKTLKKNSKDIKDGVSNGLEVFATKVTENMGIQNTALIKTLQDSQNKLLDNQLQTLNYLINSQKKQHDNGLEQRTEVLSQIKTILKKLCDSSKAARVAVVEFHNSKTNIDGLPFLWFDIQAEFFKKGIQSISTNAKDLQAFTLIDVIKKVNEDENHICWFNKESLDNLYKESAVLYDYLVNKLSAQTVVFLGLYNQQNKLLGLLCFEFDFDYNFEDVPDVARQTVAQTRYQIESLLSYAPLEKFN